MTGDHIFLSEEGNPWYPPAAEMVRSIVEWLVREKGVSVNVKNSVRGAAGPFVALRTSAQELCSGDRCRVVGL